MSAILAKHIRRIHQRTFPKDNIELSDTHTYWKHRISLDLAEISFRLKNGLWFVKVVSMIWNALSKTGGNTPPYNRASGIYWRQRIPWFETWHGVTHSISHDIECKKVHVFNVRNMCAHVAKHPRRVNQRTFTHLPPTINVTHLSWMRAIISTHHKLARSKQIS